MVLGHQGFGDSRVLHRDRGTAQHVDRAGRADAARRERRTDRARDAPRTIRSPAPTSIADPPLPHRRRGPRAVEHRDRQPARRGRLARQVQIDWDWEVAAQRARSESEQTGSRNRRAGSAPTTCSRKSTPGATTRSAARTTRRRDRRDHDQPGAPGHVEPDGVRRADLRRAVRPAGRQGRAWPPASSTVTKAINDIPDEQFQRGLIFGTEAVSAAARRVDSWSAYVEFSVPRARKPRGQRRAALRRLQRLRQTRPTRRSRDALGAASSPWPFRASWGTGFRAPSLAQIGLGPSQESQFFVDAFGCADNPTYCARDRLQGHVRRQPEPEGRGIGELQRRRGLETDRLVAGRGGLLGHQAGQQDRRGQLRLPVPAVLQRPGQHGLRRGTPLPGDTLGPLQSINSSFINIGEQSTNGVDVSVHLPRLDHGRRTVRRASTTRACWSSRRVELSADGTASCRATSPASTSTRRIASC